MDNKTTNRLFKFTDRELQDIKQCIDKVAEEFGITHWAYDDRRQTDIDREATRVD